MKATFIFLLLFCVPCFALDPKLELTQYGFDQWQIEQGLPGNTIHAILVARTGYLWLGTQEGLIRFDGVRFTIFDRQNTPELKSNHIQKLYEDSNGTIWIGTYAGGLSSYSQGKFRTYTTEDGLSENDVSAITEGKKGILYIGTFGGDLFSFDGSSFHRELQMKEIGWTGIRHLLTDRNNGLWICSRSGVRYRKNNRWIDSPVLDLLPSGGAATAYLDRKGTVWLSIYGSGLWRYTGGKLGHVTEWTAGNVLAMLEDSDGNFWLATEGKGLARWNASGIRFFDTSHGLPSEIVNTLALDPEGSLWIGTRGGGLARFRNQKIIPYTTQEGLSSNMIRSLYQDPDGVLWIGTYGGGLNRMENGTVSTITAKDGLNSNLVSAAVRDDSGSLWIATKDAGVHRLKDGKLTSFTTREGLPDPQTWSLYPDGDNGIWVGTAAGLANIRGDTMKTYGAKDGLISEVVYPILRDHQGTLWVGTLKGLHRWRKGAFEALTMKDGLCGEIVLSLHEDKEGTLWVGTVGGGLARYQKGKFDCFGTRNGLADDSVYSILEDDQATLWLSSGKGIFRVNKQELNAYTNKSIPSIPVVRFGTADGMKSRECNGGSQPSAWKSANGKLFFPTIRGFVEIDPSRLVPNNRVPPVFLEAVSVDGKRLSTEQEGKISPGSGRLVFDYTALSFLAPERVRFRYQLEGFDRDYMDAGSARSVTYTNIPPGRYRFHVIAGNNDGVWNYQGASYTFVLLPHFHQTVWFYGLCIVAVFSAGFGAQRLRLRGLRRRQEQLAKLVEERTLDLRRAQNELEEANQSLERRVQEGINALRDAERMAAYGNMVAGVAHEVRQPLFALQAAAYVLSDKMKAEPSIQSQLRTLDRETKRMSDLMNDLLEFARPPALNSAPEDPVSVLKEAVESFQAAPDQHTLEVKIEAALDLPKLRMDRSRILQVLLNLMTNARKHARGASRIVLSVDQPDPAEIRFRINDDGAGIGPEHKGKIFEPFYTTGRGTGLGLAIVHRIVTDHGGRIDFESAPEKGTTFSVYLPE